MYERKLLLQRIFLLQLRNHKFALFLAIKTVCKYFTFCRDVDTVLLIYFDILG